MSKDRTGPRDDFGFHDELAHQERLINRDGTFNVARSRGRFIDNLSYGPLLQTTWPLFLCAIAIMFFGLNVLFASIYVLCGPQALVANGPDPQVAPALRAFFFSIHTLATIGYGNVVPVGGKANVVAAVESFLGVLTTSLVAGLFFARFARPRVRLRFSLRSVIIRQHEPALVFRIANLSRTVLLQAEASVALAYFESEEATVRRYKVLDLERERIAFLPLAWTLVHPITEKSPLHGMTEHQFKALRAEIILQVNGVDQSSSQMIYARVSYVSSEVVWNGRFAEIYRRDQKSNLLSIDLDSFDTIETP